jgi:long-subunit fatty acid transport protein
VAAAGGLFLPGAGAISTSRAGASVAATDDGEALALNPAGLASAGSGTFVQLGISAIDYFMSFHRNGNYDAVSEEAFPYEGMRYPTVTNDAKPPLGIGSYQPVPLIAVVTDLGGRVPGLHAAVGLYAPNAYPFREMNTVNGKPFYIPNDAGSYDFPASFEGAPPPTRYDVIHEEAAIILPSLAVSYRINPKVDVGARFSAGTANLNSTVAVWGLANYDEYVKKDGIFTLDAKGFVYNWQLGTNVHPTPNIDLAAQFTAPIYIHAQGDAVSVNGSAVVPFPPDPVVVTPFDNGCKAGVGSPGHLKGCVDVELPMTATVAGRYKFLDESGALKGDVELDVGWEHWGASCDYTKDPTCLNPSDFHVLVNAQAAAASTPDQGIPLKAQHVSHGLRDTYSARLGGSWHFPVGNNAVIARGGVGYDSAAAKPGWERVDFDGAARTMVAAGASYKMNKVQIDAGFGVILEGTRTDERTCNPSGNIGDQGCRDTPGYPASDPTTKGTDLPIPDRKGPDPINPVVVPNVQSENPVNEGTFKSHYLFFMLGASYRF